MESRKKRRLAHYLDEAIAAQARGSNFLIDRAISVATLNQYRKEYDDFKVAKNLKDVKNADPKDVDTALSGYFEERFFAGDHATRGMKIVASLMHNEPDYSKFGTSRLPKTWKALKGWRKLTPGRSRRPEPLRVWAGLANAMARKGQVLAGFFVLLSVSTYFRPVTLLAVKPPFLVPPMGPRGFWSILGHPIEANRPSKTGDSDIAVQLDSRWLQWATPIFELLKAQPDHMRIWTFNYYEYYRAFKDAVGELGMDLVPYQTRHSGASIDRYANERTALATKLRGGWASDASVKRYERHARLAQSASRHSSALDAYCRQCEGQLADIFLRGRCVALPPRARA